MPASTSKMNSVGKNRLQADAESYNNIYQVWKFNITKFGCTLEEKVFKDIDCKLFTIPHKHYQPPGVNSNRRKMKQDRKNKNKAEKNR